RGTWCRGGERGQRRGRSGGGHQGTPRRGRRLMRVAVIGGGVIGLSVAWRLAGRGCAVTVYDPAPGAGASHVAAGMLRPAGELGGLPVRPVKGQLVRLRGPGVLRRVVRGWSDGHEAYLVPRPDGEVVVGATSEERRDATVTAGAVLDLLRAAVDLVPELAEYALSETQVGFRPGTPDNAPIIGELRPGLLVATGHYRNGVLLAPVTADAVADLVTGGPDVELVKAYGPERF